MNIQLFPLREEETIAFKEEMQEAFQHGFMAYYKDDNQWQVLPDKDFYQPLRGSRSPCRRGFARRREGQGQRLCQHPHHQRPCNGRSHP